METICLYVEKKSFCGFHLGSTRRLVDHWWYQFGRTRGNFNNRFIHCQRFLFQQLIIFLQNRQYVRLGSHFTRWWHFSPLYRQWRNFQQISSYWRQYYKHRIQCKGMYLTTSTIILTFFFYAKKKEILLLCLCYAIVLCKVFSK